MKRRAAFEKRPSIFRANVYGCMRCESFEFFFLKSSYRVCAVRRISVRSAALCERAKGSQMRRTHTHTHNALLEFRYIYNNNIMRLDAGKLSPTIARRLSL